MSFESILYAFHTFYLKHCNTALIINTSCILTTGTKLYFRRMDVYLVGAEAMQFDSLTAFNSSSFPIVIEFNIFGSRIKNDFEFLSF